MAAGDSATATAGEDLENLALDSSSSAASAASTDPLLHPPPSPTSPSSANSSPTAAADHDAFVVEDGEDDTAPTPTHHVPATSDEASPMFAQIIVSEPKKHAEPAAGAVGVIPGSGSYFSYLISTRATDGGEFSVRRRFRDVVALADSIAATHRGLFVPLRPDKSIVEGQVMQRHDFVNQRCASLQRYLRRLAAHPTIGRSAELHAFLTETSGILTCEGESPRSNPALSSTTSTAVAAPISPAKSGMDFFGMFRDLKQTVANGWVPGWTPPPEEETDTKFLAHKAKLENFQVDLTTASQQVEVLLKAHDDLRTTTAQMGMTFFKLAKFEKDDAITYSSQKKRAAVIKNFANAVIEVSRTQAKLNAALGEHLGTIYEYMETMTSVHNAFTDRSNALLHVQNLSADLFHLHNQAAKLESVSSRGMDQGRSRYQKIEELKETIRAAEDTKSHARKEYEIIKENNMSEIKRLNEEKHKDLLEMMKGFVTNQVSYSDDIASIWAKVAEQTEGYRQEQLK